MLGASELPLRQGAGGTLYRLTAVPSAMGPCGGRPGLKARWFPDCLMGSDLFLYRLSR